VSRVVRNPNHVHQSLAAQSGSDVALLELASEPAGAGQARLPRPADGAGGVGGAARAAGFGETVPGDIGSYSDTLLGMGATVISDADCKAAAPWLEPATQLCARPDADKSLCFGDSGGPLVVDSGAGQDVLIGDASLGVPSAGGDCVRGGLDVWGRLGADPLNAWVRQTVPLAEIDMTPATPAVGQAVTLKAAPDQAQGVAPYSSFSWDLDGDGRYGDATGATASLTVPDGRHAVGLQASNGSSTETRRVALAGQGSVVAFAAPAATVTEGGTAALQVTKPGSGSGAVSGKIHSGTARPGADFAPGPPTATLAAADHATTLSVRTVDDLSREKPRTLTVDLVSGSPSLTVAPPAQETVRILDNDRSSLRIAGVRAVRAAGGGIALRVRVAMPAAGRLRVAVARVGRRAARRSKAGVATVSLPLSRRDAAVLQRARHVRYHVAATEAATSGARGTARRRVAVAPPR
jgi:hypothetical protein